MTIFTFLLYALPGPFLIANPAPTTHWMTNNTGYKNWASDTGDRLQMTSISFLIIGSIAFILAICLILFEDRWVEKIVSRFPNQLKEEDEEPPATEVEIDPKETMSYREDQDADIIKREKDTNASDSLAKETNVGSDLQK